MVSLKMKRNIWLALAIVSPLAVIDRAIRVWSGEMEWWQLASSVVISAWCFKFYFCFSRKYKEAQSACS